MVMETLKLAIPTIYNHVEEPPSCWDTCFDNVKDHFQPFKVVTC